MSLELRSVAVWVGVFLIFELPAHFGLVPWYTLSRTVWVGEAWWPIVGVFVALFSFVLLGHFELHWSARWLLSVAIAALLLIASRLIGQVT